MAAPDLMAYFKHIQWRRDFHAHLYNKQLRPNRVSFHYSNGVVLTETIDVSHLSRSEAEVFFSRLIQGIRLYNNRNGSAQEESVLETAE